MNENHQFQTLKSIAELYKRIPNTKCKGCGKCCQHAIQPAPEEVCRMGGYSWDGKCVHLVDGGCAVYENRPFVCRLFGASEVLQCDDCFADRYLTAEETSELVRQFVRLKTEQEGVGHNNDTVLN